MSGWSWAAGWGGLAGAAAALGFVLFDAASPHAVAMTTAFAAGAVLAMPVDTMVPEACAVAHDAAGLITLAGFLLGFALSKGVGAQGNVGSQPKGDGTAPRRRLTLHSCKRSRIRVQSHQLGGT